jgi:hypothetical protein
MAKYNCPTSPNNSPIADADIDKAYRRAIDSCQHLTPETEGELDNLLAQALPAPQSTQAGEPSLDFLEAEAETAAELDWMFDDPDPSAFEAA